MQSGELELRFQIQSTFAFRHGEFPALIAWQFCLKLVARRGLNIAANKFEEEQQFFDCSRGIANRTEHLEFYSAVSVEVWIWLVFLILEICP